MVTAKFLCLKSMSVAADSNGRVVSIAMLWASEQASIADSEEQTVQLLSWVVKAAGAGRLMRGMWLLYTQTYTGLWGMYHWVIDDLHGVGYFVASALYDGKLWG